jgi:hypothetical protein
MSNDKPDNNPTVVDAAIDGYGDVADTATSSGEAVAQSAHNAAGALKRDVRRHEATANRSYAASAGNLSVTFHDVDAVTTTIQDLNRFATPLIGTLGTVATDPDLIASLPLSPITGASAEAAALTAAGRLTGNLVVGEALALITASVVSTYQLADSALSNAAANLRAGIGNAGSLLSGISTVGGSSLSADGQIVSSIFGGLGGLSVATGDLAGALITLPRLIEGVFVTGIGAATSGILLEGSEALARSIHQSLGSGSSGEGVGLLSVMGLTTFGVEVGTNFTRNFSWDGALADSADEFQGMLGATGSSYDDILGLLIHDGHTLGMFRDGDAELGGSGLSDAVMNARNSEAVNDSNSSIYGSDEALNHDEQHHILPHDVASLFAGSAQIDYVGKDGFADIRIIESADGQGHSTYIVQIPSTQGWTPWAGSVPNDSTSDLYAMRYGDQTALSHAVFAAMNKAGIPTGAGAPPVMVTGFSLGGITAGAIAANPHGFNVEQVVTAGAPIGGMSIPTSTHVTALEARQDPVPSLDGTANPSTWTTVRHDAYPLATESGYTVLSAAHDANRYAVLARENAAVNNDPGFAKFFQGTQTVTDYYARR